VLTRPCVLCGGNASECHEITGGRHNRHYTKKHPRFWLAVCAGCHKIVQDEPKARQYARKLLAEPRVFDVGALRERTPFVDAADVLREIANLL
jgi:ABC-type sulfate transport system substrate-binding protein